jgi:hypothetical protein
LTPGQWATVSTRESLTGGGGVVDELVEEVAGVEEVNVARRLRGPEVLPAPAEGVLGLGDELVQVLGEDGEGAVAIEDDRVVVSEHAC